MKDKDDEKLGGLIDEFPFVEKTQRRTKDD